MPSLVECHTQSILSSSPSTSTLEDQHPLPCLTQGEAQLLVLVSLLFIVFVLLAAFCVFELWIKTCYRKDKKLLSSSNSLNSAGSSVSIA
ncbi:hypothetical protein PENTCL1PPCAC_2614 [Pristionchus entomophagus]|uniref:Uncharacterized protein n=1 Tax=Pristionchus entomophagus TaxID=358040 RepID=A0AAV5SK09_9BILA|nr:hypothetical protein PENTCL1PPCAC_2614 [Pristionchus entomophagus]